MMDDLYDKLQQALGFGQLWVKRTKQEFCFKWWPDNEKAYHATFRIQEIKVAKARSISPMVTIMAARLREEYRNESSSSKT